jgi:hypothetical protein
VTYTTSSLSKHLLIARLASAGRIESTCVAEALEPVDTDGLPGSVETVVTVS